MLDGITFGGFNIVDIHRLSKMARLPGIAVQRTQPGMRELIGAIRKIFVDWRKRVAIVKRTGEVIKFSKNGHTFYYQFAGVDPKQCEEILGVCTTRGNVPSPCERRISSQAG